MTVSCLRRRLVSRTPTAATTRTGPGSRRGYSSFEVGGQVSSEVGPLCGEGSSGCTPETMSTKGLTHDTVSKVWTDYRTPPSVSWLGRPSTTGWDSGSSSFAGPRSDEGGRDPLIVEPTRA